MAILIDFVLIFALMGSALTSTVGLFNLLFRRPRKRGFKIMAFSFMGMIVALSITGTVQEGRAVEAGFTDATDRKLAREQGYTFAQRWNQVRHAALTKQRLPASKSAKTIKQTERQPETQTSQEKDNANDGSRIVQQANAQSEQSKCILKTCKMTEDVIKAFKAHHNLEAKPAIPNKPPCREDGYCDFSVNKFKIQIYGNGIIDIRTTTQAPHSEYREICATAFSGLSGANINFAREAMTAAFVQASQAGSFKQDVNSVEIKISPGLNNILACEFFKYGR